MSVPSAQLDPELQAAPFRITMADLTDIALARATASAAGTAAGEFSALDLMTIARSAPPQASPEWRPVIRTASQQWSPDNCSARQPNQIPASRCCSIGAPQPIGQAWGAGGHRREAECRLGRGVWCMYPPPKRATEQVSPHLPIPGRP
jgi:hypothetical protein